MSKLWFIIFASMFILGVFAFIDSQNLVSADSSKTLTLNNLTDGKEIYAVGKKWVNLSDILVNSESEYRCTWYPDNHPKNASKLCTFELQIDDKRTGYNVSFIGEGDLPKYYSGSFDFNSSDNRVAVFKDIMPVLSWKFSTKYNTVLKNYTEYNETGETIVSYEDREYFNYNTINPTTIKNTLRRPIFLDPNVSACGNLNVTNSIYTLNTSLTSGLGCFKVLANNITLEGNNYQINYAMGIGIENLKYNNTNIRNLIFNETTGYSYNAISFENTYNARIINITINADSLPISIQNSKNTTLENINENLITITSYVRNTFYNNINFTIKLKDNIITGSPSYVEFIFSANKQDNLLNITNTTRNNLTPLNITFNDNNVTFINNWYLDLNITNSTGPVNGASINITNIQGVNLSGTTSSNGLIRFVLPEFIRNRTESYFYYSNYSINVSYGSSSNATSINLSTNTYRWLYLSPSASSTCTYSGTGNYLITCSDNCIYTSRTNITAGNNVSIIGAGTLTFNSGGSWRFNGTNQRVSVSSSCKLAFNSGGGWNI